MSQAGRAHYEWTRKEKRHSKSTPRIPGSSLRPLHWLPTLACATPSSYVHCTSSNYLYNSSAESIKTGGGSALVVVQLRWWFSSQWPVRYCITSLDFVLVKIEKGYGVKQAPHSVEVLYHVVIPHPHLPMTSLSQCSRILNSLYHRGSMKLTKPIMSHNSGCLIIEAL